MWLKMHDKTMNKRNDEARVIVFLFSGYGQMDRQTDGHGFGILTWKHVGTQKNFNSKLKIRS